MSTLSTAGGGAPKRAPPHSGTSLPARREDLAEGAGPGPAWSGAGGGAPGRDMQLAGGGAPGQCMFGFHRQEYNKQDPTSQQTNIIIHSTTSRSISCYVML